MQILHYVIMNLSRHIFCIRYGYIIYYIDNLVTDYILDRSRIKRGIHKLIVQLVTLTLNLKT